MEILSIREMYSADQNAVAAGIPSLLLMETAGEQAAKEIFKRFGKTRVAVFCGPGNNGGDGLVVARHLKKLGAKVKVALFGGRESLARDAEIMALKWDDSFCSFEKIVLDEVDLIVDAIFGAGLSRPIAGDVKTLMKNIHARRIPAVAIDIPSGVNGDTGEINGFAIPAVMTVTFFRPKFGHYLLPGRALCGDLKVVDIGIPDTVLNQNTGTARLNGPDIWLTKFPWPGLETHKYKRGHGIVLSGPKSNSGAARLAARGALRCGAGLITIASPMSALDENSVNLTSIMAEGWTTCEEFGQIISDVRRNAVLLGPGAGVGNTTRENTLLALNARKNVVLDADALTSFENETETLFQAITGDCILTPHEGEFGRLFSINGDKISRAIAASRLSGAIVVVKGADTVISSPEGRVVVNHNGSPFLATAGSGDVLAGICLGLIAQGMPSFEAACCAVWIHAEAGQRFGPGLIAEDLSEQIPPILAGLTRKAPSF